MSTLQSLFILLVVAYVGGFLMGGRGVRGVGLPSGSEWLVLGIVAGPAALGVVGGEEVSRLAPVALVATGWIALLVGLGLGVDGDRRIPAGGLLLGLVAGGVGTAAVGAAAWGVLQLVPAASVLFPSADERAVVVVGLAVSLADTSRHLVPWARQRLGARGPLVDRLADVVLTDDVVPIAVLSLLMSVDASRGVRALPMAGIAMGAVLGLVAALLLGRTMRTTTFWALLFGVSLVATGVAEQLDLSSVGPGFALGLVLALASPLRREARQMVGGIAGAVILPALFLAGGRTQPILGPALWIAAAAIAARLLSGLLVAGLVAATSTAARRGGPALALAFFPTGSLGVALALAIALRYPGPAGDLVLAATVAAAVAGEFVGPPALRLALRRAGETPAAPPAEPAPGEAAPGEAAEGAP